MLVPEFCSNRSQLFDDMFYESLPQYCFEEGCGFPMEMTQALTQLHCSNPKCPSKVIRRMMAIANSLGIKDLGVSKATKIVQQFGVDNPLLIFAYDPDDDGALEGCSMEVCKKLVQQFEGKRNFTLAEFVRIANLPFIQTSAMSIFGDYDTLDDAYRDIEDGGVDFIRKKLSIKKGSDEDTEESISVRALKIYDSLMTYKSDLYQGIKYVNIIKVKQEGMIKLKAVCSDEVGAPFRTKADFYSTVNNSFDNVHVEFLGSVTKSIDYLVWAGADGSPARLTNKVKKTQGYNEKYEFDRANGTLKDGEHYIPIVTAQQFLKILEDL